MGGIFAALLIAPAMAQTDSNYNDKEVIGGGQPSETLPAPRSSHDPAPPVASPAVPASDLVQQAGVGGQTAYGRAGVLELGGSAGLTRASDLTQISLNPTIGWFLVDNFELSGILGVSYSNVDGASSAFFSVLAEPSYHLPFSNTAFGFLGIGAGIAYAEDLGVGFALQPRVGGNFMVGRSGILTPALYLGYTTHDVSGDIAPTGDVGTTLLGVSLSYGLNIGYTVMW